MIFIWSAAHRFLCGAGASPAKSSELRNILVQAQQSFPTV
jgi:hypothetical protein